jgi:hypothetical protein
MTVRIEKRWKNGFSAEVDAEICHDVACPVPGAADFSNLSVFEDYACSRLEIAAAEHIGDSSVYQLDARAGTGTVIADEVCFMPATCWHIRRSQARGLGSQPAFQPTEDERQRHSCAYDFEGFLS